MRRCAAAILVDVVDGLHAEWRALSFDDMGRAVNPDTADPVGALRLAKGRHGSHRAWYAATYAHLPRSSDSPGGPEDRELTIELVRDGSTELSGRVNDAVRRGWSAGVELSHVSSLQFSINAFGKMREVMAASGAQAPGGCLGWLLRGPAKIDATVDLEPLERHREGQLARVVGRAGRYSYEVNVSHGAGQGRSEIGVDVIVSGRRSGAVVMVLFG